jgi:hypothetical protein
VRRKKPRGAEEWDAFTFSLDRLVDVGASIVGIGTYSGRYKKTGKTMTARVVHVWDMDDGRVVRFEQFVDSKTVAEAVTESSRAGCLVENRLRLRRGGADRGCRLDCEELDRLFPLNVTARRKGQRDVH